VLHVRLELAALAFRGCASRLDFLLGLLALLLDFLVGAGLGGLDVLVGLGAGALDLLRGALGQLLGLGARVGQCGLGLGAYLVGLAPDGLRGPLGRRTALGVGLLRLGAPGGQGDLEVAEAVLGVRRGLGADPLGLGQAGGEVVGGGALDRLGLLLGERQDLLDARAEVLERDLGADDAGLLADLGHLLLQPVDLPGHGLELRICLLALAGQHGDLVLGAGDVPLDLLLVVTPQGGLEIGLRGRVRAQTEEFTAVRHASHPHIRIVPRHADTPRLGGNMRLIVICQVK
jgi:hypothetical protein